MKVSYHNKPFKLESLPVKEIHVIDDWMDHETWVWLNKYITGLRRWGFNNSVVYKDGTVTETTWGMVFYSKFFEQPDPNDDYGKPIKQKVIDRLCDQFGIEWQQFDYCGMNGQTEKLQGTLHTDSFREKNISFLWFVNLSWDDEWGGALRFYKQDALEEVKGFSEDIVDKYQVAKVDYKPNRLVIMDGRIPHSADAPINSTYNLRQTMVVRGNVAKIT